MLLERIETPGLAHYSYLVGCEGAGEAVVVDPRRDVEVYTRMASERNLRITRVLETHIHADYASGAADLAGQTGAPLAVSRYDAGETYEVQHPHQDLSDGDTIDVGAVRIKALHTPGHTPEHMSFLLFDRARSESTPMALLSGDFLFVGSAGRPDLLGEASAAPLAAALYGSLRKRIASLPDHVEIHPAHGAGSMCGSGMAGRPTSTLGFERLVNPYFQERSREAFVEWALAHVPPFPPYYKRMKAFNSKGAPPAGPILKRATSTGLAPAKAQALAQSDAVIVDVRSPREFAVGHPAGAISVGMAAVFSVWAAWAVPHDAPIVLLATRAEDVEQAARGLVRVGLDDIAGFIEGGFEAWRNAGLPVEQTPVIPPEEARALAERGELALLDVRSDAEWRSGHAPAALHIHAGFTAEKAAEVAALGQPVATLCKTGYRATLAASLLRRAGLPDVRIGLGGMDAWLSQGLPIEQGEAAGVGVA